MDMKNERMWNKMGRKFRSLLRNRKGMENWGLVFVVGGVALVTALTLAQQAGTSGGSFITKATDKADTVMDQYTADATTTPRICPKDTHSGGKFGKDVCAGHCAISGGTCTAIPGDTEHQICCVPDE